MAPHVSTARDYIVIIDIDKEGAIYLGRLCEGGANQGVRLPENANVYTERGARNLAGQFPRATIAHKDGLK